MCKSHICTPICKHGYLPEMFGLHSEPYPPTLRWACTMHCAGVVESALLVVCSSPPASGSSLIQIPWIQYSIGLQHLKPQTNSLRTKTAMADHYPYHPKFARFLPKYGALSHLSPLSYHPYHPYHPKFVRFLLKYESLITLITLTLSSLSPLSPQICSIFA